MGTEESFAQLQMRFIDPIQFDYEVIRPVVLFSETVTNRSEKTEIPRTTIGEKARRFAKRGMLGLVDRRGEQSGRQVGETYPNVIANYVLYLKQLYPPIHNREIVRILANKFGCKTNHHTVKHFLENNPVPLQLEFTFKKFHEFEEAYEARWTVVRLYYEGWNKKSVAGLLKLSRRHVGRLVEAFEKDGFAALEDRRTRPVNHPDNQMTLPFLEEVFQVQEDFPRLGRFRIHGILEQKLNEDVPSERTVGRAMAYNRVLRKAPPPWPPPPEEIDKEKTFPYRPLFRHHYWFIDIRYLVESDGKTVYSICVIEGHSRKILAGMVSRYQDELSVLQLFHAALAEYGAPHGIVSDNGSVFTAKAYRHVTDHLEIELHYIEKGKPWQNLIESQFQVQSRMADALFEKATTFEEVQEQHALFVQLFNTTNHWAHRNRVDDCTTPVTVLGWKRGREIDPLLLRQAFRHLQFTRSVNQHGYLSIQRFYIYAERGLNRKRVSVWIYEDRLHVEYRQTLMARYSCKLDRRRKSLKEVAKPIIYRTNFDLPQLEMFELDDEEWRKVLRRPPYVSRKKADSSVKQLALFNAELMIWLFFFLLG